MIKLVIALTVLAVGAGLAAAQAPPDLIAAQRAGIAGERYDGYMGFAGTPTDSVRKQVAAINIRRRALYLDLSARRGVTAQVVAIATGCELLSRLGPGEAYMLPDGAWRRRAADEPPPVPAHCRS